MVPWGTGNPISSGYLNTLVFLTEKPPPLSVSEGGGSMSLIIQYIFCLVVLKTTFIIALLSWQVLFFLLFLCDRNDPDLSCIDNRVGIDENNQKSL